VISVDLLPIPPAGELASWRTGVYEAMISPGLIRANVPSSAHRQNNPVRRNKAEFFLQTVPLASPRRHIEKPIHRAAQIDRPLPPEVVPFNVFDLWCN